MKNIKKTTNDRFNSFKGKAIEFLSVFIITIILFCFARRAAFLNRGYEAVGGEVFVLSLPLYYFYIKTNFLGSKGKRRQ